MDQLLGWLTDCRLSPLTKRMFNELGSAVVQNVKFRDAWAFVGQKGIQGFTEFELVGNVAPSLSDLALLYFEHFASLA